MTVPVLFIVFNRPDTTRRVLDAIGDARPSHLYVAADGPRPGVGTDEANCEGARAAATAVDWPCEVHTLFREENLGCGLGPSTAISWFLENVSEGIVLEDDCVPDATFFRFCEELLERYRDVPRLMQVSGANYLGGRKRGNASYYFSSNVHSVGGWATWRRAWDFFDYEAASAERRAHGVWDWQWMLAVRGRGGLAAVPNGNLISNIGFGRADATHTPMILPQFADLPRVSMQFPLRHPRRIRPMDRYVDPSPSSPEKRSYAGIPLRIVRIGLAKIAYHGRRWRGLISK